jgi:hypothetical protein
MWTAAVIEVEVPVQRLASDGNSVVAMQIVE